MMAAIIMAIVEILTNLRKEHILTGDIKRFNGNNKIWIQISKEPIKRRDILWDFSEAWKLHDQGCL